MKRTEKTRGITAITLLGLLASVGITSPSFANENGQEIDALMAEAHQAVGDTEVTTPLSESLEGFSASSANVDIDVPVDGNATVTIAAEGVDLAVNLPALFNSEEISLSEDGAALVGDKADSVVGVVEATDDGVRLSTVINDAGASSTYEYEFGDDVHPVVLEDGSGVLMSGDAASIVGMVAAPWAIDASGTDVPTHYTVQGNALVQVVEHHGAAYPVVADPRVSIGWKIYVKYNKTEVKSMVTGWRGTVNDKAKYASVFCAAIVAGGIPGAIGAAACAVYVYDSMSSVMTTFKSAAKNNKCMEMQYTYPGGLLVGWKSYSC